MLVVSIQKLSNPNEEPIVDRRVFALFELEQSTNAAYLLPINQIRDEKWKEELKKRIDAKTVHKKVMRHFQISLNVVKFTLKFNLKSCPKYPKT